MNKELVKVISEKITKQAVNTNFEYILMTLRDIMNLTKEIEEAQAKGITEEQAIIFLNNLENLRDTLIVDIEDLQN